MLTATKGGKINISEEKDTKSLAERFSKLIKQGDFILLSGNLGVGKTTFIKYIINSLQKANKHRTCRFTPQYHSFYCKNYHIYAKKKVRVPSWGADFKSQNA